MISILRILDSIELYCLFLAFSQQRTSYIETVYRISDVIVSVLASSAVDSGFESRSSQSKDYKIGICCFST
jgi:hypothetical protein